MSRDDIIRMAREAGMDANTGSIVDGERRPAINALKNSVPVEWLERFAALVAAAEREAWRKALEPAFRGRMGSEQVREIVQSAIRSRVDHAS